MQFKYKLLLSIFLLLLFPKNILAQTPTPNSTPVSTNTPTPAPASTPQNYSNVTLSEIYARNSEWVEIYNNNDFEVDLNGWFIRDASTVSTHRKDINQKISAKTYSSFDISFLNDDGDTVKLYYLEEKAENLKDSYSYTSSETDKSWSKVSGSWCKTNPSRNSANNSCITESTPIPTATPSPTPTTVPEINNIRINEIYPCPADNGNEWVEIYNNNDFEVNLNDWYIKDSMDNKRKISDLTIAGKSFIYFAFSSGFLNDDGDIIALYDSQDREKYKIPEIYPLISEGISWAYINSSWCLAQPTKGSFNTVCFADEDDLTDEKSTSKPLSKKDEDSKNMLLAQNRDLPQINNKNSEATVAGIASETSTPQTPKPNLTIPLIISSTGFLILLGASIPFLKPKLVPFFAKFKRQKSASPSF